MRLDEASSFLVQPYRRQGRDLLYSILPKVVLIKLALVVQNIEHELAFLEVALELILVLIAVVTPANHSPIVHCKHASARVKRDL